MQIVELCLEIAPLVLSTLATIVAFVKGRTKKTKSVEEIKATADKKYTAYVEKQCKKNNIEDISVITKE